MMRLSFMMEFTEDRIVEMIRSKFNVIEVTRGVYSMEFEISDIDYSAEFEDIARALEGARYICRLVRQDGKPYIIVQKYAPQTSGRILNSPWTPRIMFIVVCAFVMIDGYVRTIQLNDITYVGEPLQMAGIYTLALLGILGVHESGHLAAAHRHRLKTTWPFFIPGLPIIGIPTFGAFIKSGGLTINRRILFDVAIAGPVAGAVVAIIVAIFGAWTAPVIDEHTAAALMRNNVLSEFQLGEPLLMHAALALFDKGGSGIVIMTPLLWASWIGFLITFLNLLPAWQLDGGHMARTMMNATIHRYATYGSILVLVVLNFWVMALLILVLSFKNSSVTTLDEVTPLTQDRRRAYVGIIALAVLCAPIPVGILP